MSIKDLMVVRIIIGIAAKIWAASGAALLTCLMVYCFYGTFTAMGLLAATILGTAILIYYIPITDVHRIQ